MTGAYVAPSADPPLHTWSTLTVTYAVVRGETDINVARGHILGEE